MLIKYKAVSKLDGTEVSFDREAWAQAAVKEGWIDSFLPYEAPEPVPESPEEIRIREIDAELEKLDRDAQRPLCSVLSGLGSGDDAALLAAIEGMKIELREERRALAGGGEATPDVAEASDADPVDADAFLHDDGFSGEAPQRLFQPDEAIVHQIIRLQDHHAVDGDYFLLNSTGSTYHLWECVLAKTGKKMTLAEIAEKYPDASPCATCCPPAFPAVTVDEGGE